VFVLITAADTSAVTWAAREVGIAYIEAKPLLRPRLWELLQRIANTPAQPSPVAAPRSLPVALPPVRQRSLSVGTLPRMKEIVDQMLVPAGLSSFRTPPRIPSFGRAQ
jgi:hypothetical protein